MIPISCIRALGVLTGGALLLGAMVAASPAGAGDLGLHFGVGHYNDHVVGHHRFYPRPYYPRHWHDHGDYLPYAPSWGHGDHYYPHRPPHRYPHSHPHHPAYRYSDRYGYDPYSFQPRNFNPSSTLPPEHPSYDVHADRDAWSLLGLGQPDTAQQIFANLARRYPDSGRYRAGYALASAARGDLPAGAWAMRRALDTAPRDMGELKPDRQLQSTLRGILYHYRGSSHPDARLMQATLHYLLGNSRDAQQLADSLQQAGDRSTSLSNLQGLIQGQHTDNGAAPDALP